METVSALADSFTKAETWKILTAASSIGIVIVGRFIWNKCVASKHDNIQTLFVDEYHPIHGHLLAIIRNRPKFQEWLYNGMKSQGFPKIASLCRSGIPSSHIVFLNDPKLVKFVFETEFPKAELRRKERGYEFFGDGIFTSNGEEWKFQRKVASRMFSMRNLKDYMFAMSLKHTKSTIKKMMQFDQSLDINDILGRFTLDTFCEIAFGQNINSVQTYPKIHKFGIAFDDMSEKISFRSSNPFWKVERLLGIRNEKFIAKDVKILHSFVEEVVDNIRKGGNSSSENNISDAGSGAHNILSLFLKHDPNLTVSELKDVVLNFIIAGRDTTRMLLSWFIYEICQAKNSEAKKKLYEEIDSFSSEPNYSDFRQKFKYLEGCLCETLRLWPSVPMLSRECIVDIELPLIDGKKHIIRKGDFILVNNYIFGRNPKIWGDDALVFDPLRWGEKGVNAFNQYKFTAFNINPRLCLGKQFAITEAKVFAYYFMKQFEFEIVEGFKMQTKPGIILNMQNGLMVKLKARE